jgi:hypothetical protein
MTERSITSGLGTKDFVVACEAQGIRLIPFPVQQVVPIKPPEQAPLFGRHIRETFDAWRRLYQQES